MGRVAFSEKKKKKKTKKAACCVICRCTTCHLQTKVQLAALLSNHGRVINYLTGGTITSLCGVQLECWLMTSRPLVAVSGRPLPQQALTLEPRSRPLAPVHNQGPRHSDSLSTQTSILRCCETHPDTPRNKRVDSLACAPRCSNSLRTRR